MVFFSLQAPVYYHLMVCAILVLLGFDVERPEKSFLYPPRLALGRVFPASTGFLFQLLWVSFYTLEKPFNETISGIILEVHFSLE